MAPLTRLTSTTKFVWIEDYEFAFENVKFALTRAPILPYTGLVSYLILLMMFSLIKGMNITGLTRTYCHQK